MACLENHPSGKKNVLALGEIGLKLEVTEGCWLLGTFIWGTTVRVQSGFGPCSNAELGQWWGSRVRKRRARAKLAPHRG